MNKREKEVLQAQLDTEKKVLKKLEAQYKKALNDIDDKIKLFEADITRLDSALQEDGLDEQSKAVLQSQRRAKVYQKQYQQALQGQISGTLDKLHGDQYATIQEYLNACYTDSYIGTMYDIHGQGIPLIIPIDQSAAIKAIQIDSKINKGLYTALGVNAAQLKKSIAAEVTRGIATSLSYADIARNISNATKAPLNRANIIVRTEGHRVQQASTLNAQRAAKKKGADVVKQWDSTLDGKTRDTHRQLDGQIREVDEYFEVDGKKAMNPGDFGRPEEDCNCRCASLTRAKWALDDEELQTLKDRTKFFGLDKAKDFEDFKQKYLKAAKTIAKINLDELSNIQKLKANLNGRRASIDELKEIGSSVKRYVGKYQPTEDEIAYNAAHQKVMDMSKLIRQNKLSAGSDEYRKAYYEWVNAKKKVPNLQQTRAEWLSSKLSEIRQVGTKGIENDISKHLRNSHSEMRGYVEKAYSIYPRDWVEKSIKRGTLIPKKAARGYYSDYECIIAISGEDGSAFQTAVHELGHRFEKAVPEILEAEKEFYNYRTDGEDLRWLGKGYRKGETSRFDDFINPYMGKDYGGYAYELVSMGFEYAFTDPEKLAKDSEMESWILGILATY